jgi:hypothetical protein
MNESKHPRAVTGLIILAILCTVALGLQERRSAPLAAYSLVSPVGGGPRTLLGLRGQQPLRTLPWLRTLPIGTRAFWLQPWPWVVVGLSGFGLLAWGLLWGIRRMERD